MMIFSNTPGVVGAVLAGPALPFAVTIGGGPNGVPLFPGHTLSRSILTGFEFEDQSGIGVAHTLRDRIYVYMHGERMGQASVTGVAFGGVCGFGAEGGASYTGVDAVHKYYETVRASTQGLPVRLVFGSLTVLTGFMESLKVRLEDPATGLASFAFQFKTIPNNGGRFGYIPPLPWN